MTETKREETAARAAALFSNGFHCSQAVLSACSGLFREQQEPPPELTAAMASFAGGMGQVCGALTGALAAIGFTLGKTEPKGRNHRLLDRMSRKMVREFGRITREYGGMNCSDIAAVDWSDRKAVRQFRTDPDSRRKNCVAVVRDTGGCLHDLVQEHLSAAPKAESAALNIESGAA